MRSSLLTFLLLAIAIDSEASTRLSDYDYQARKDSVRTHQFLVADLVVQATCLAVDAHQIEEGSSTVTDARFHVTRVIAGIAPIDSMVIVRQAGGTLGGLVTMVSGHSVVVYPVGEQFFLALALQEGTNERVYWQVGRGMFQIFDHKVSTGHGPVSEDAFIEKIRVLRGGR